MPVMVTSSPMLHHTPHSHPHTPLNLSPAGSPALRATNPSSLPKVNHKSSPTPSSGSQTPLGPLPSNLPSTTSSARSYARQPTQRPYQSALVSRATAGRVLREVKGDSLEFAALVAGIVQDRGVELKMGGLGLDVDGSQQQKGDGRVSKSVAGSWEIERAELIVDVPVWSPGCFQDLSTLHALRDTTLSHTHSLLAHLMTRHGITATYRLLARSAISQTNHGASRGRNPLSSGWGCIRLAPLALAPSAGKSILKPKIRRSSMDIKDCRGRGALDGPERPYRSTTTKLLGMPILAGRTGERSPAGARARVEGLKTPEMNLDEAIADDEEVAEGETPAEKVEELKVGYSRSESVSSDEDEEDADVLVAREVEKRGAKEGTAFLMTLFGGPALILV